MKIKIAVIEDIEDLRNDLVEILNMSGQITCIADFSNAEDAIDSFTAVDCELIPDVVIMDIGLPEISGNQAVRLLKPLMPATQFMIFTVYDDDDKVWDALSAGAAGYLLKTTSPDKIIEAIIELHEGGSPITPSVARKLVKVFQQKQEEEQIKKTENQTSQNTLSPREFEVLKLISEGFLYKEIAEKLFISIGTVKQHIHKSYQKLHVNNKVEAINKLF